MLMARNSQNTVISLIFNDFPSISTGVGLTYFSDKRAHQTSRTYYKELARAINSGPGAVEQARKSHAREHLHLAGGAVSFRGVTAH
jgi:DNA-binding FadR family transcriptional regulator